MYLYTVNALIKLFDKEESIYVKILCQRSVQGLSLLFSKHYGMKYADIKLYNII